MKKTALSFFAGLFVVSSFCMQQSKDLEYIRSKNSAENTILLRVLEKAKHHQNKNLSKKLKSEDQRASEKAKNNQMWLRNKINYNNPSLIKPLKQ